VSHRPRRHHQVGHEQGADTVGHNPATLLASEPGMFCASPALPFLRQVSGRLISQPFHVEAAGDRVRDLAGQRFSLLPRRSSVDTL
jgi:hypothetical protein